MKKEFNFEGAKRGPRHDPKATKIAKNVRLDVDLFLWLRQEAERTGIPYQTLLNAKLREAMNRPTVEILAHQVTRLDERVKHLEEKAS